MFLLFVCVFLNSCACGRWKMQIVHARGTRGHVVWVHVLQRCFVFVSVVQFRWRVSFQLLCFAQFE